MSHAALRNAFLTKPERNTTLAHCHHRRPSKMSRTKSILCPNVLRTMFVLFGPSSLRPWPNSTRFGPMSAKVGQDSSLPGQCPWNFGLHPHTLPGLRSGTVTDQCDAPMPSLPPLPAAARAARRTRLCDRSGRSRNRSRGPISTRAEIRMGAAIGEAGDFLFLGSIMARSCGSGRNLPMANIGVGNAEHRPQI